MSAEVPETSVKSSAIRSAVFKRDVYMFSSALDDAHELFQILLPLSAIYRDPLFMMQRYLEFTVVAERALDQGDYLVYGRQLRFLLALGDALCIEDPAEQAETISKPVMPLPKIHPFPTRFDNQGVPQKRGGSVLEELLHHAASSEHERTDQELEDLKELHVHMVACLKSWKALRNQLACVIDLCDATLKDTFEQSTSAPDSASIYQGAMCSTWTLSKNIEGVSWRHEKPSCVLSRLRTDLEAFLSGDQQSGSEMQQQTGIAETAISLSPGRSWSRETPPDSIEASEKSFDKKTEKRYISSPLSSIVSID